jgi:ATP-dependent Clp protease ATP-binding subunit ClpC
MYKNITESARKVMEQANQEAQRLGHEYIGTEHVLLGLIKVEDGIAVEILKGFGLDAGELEQQIAKIVPSPSTGTVSQQLPQTPRTKKIIDNAIEEARALGQDYVGTEHLLLGLLRDEESAASQVLLNLGLTREKIAIRVMHALGRNPAQALAVVHKPASVSIPSGPGPAKFSPALDRFGLDLTALARQKKLTPLIDREAKLEEIEIVLACRAQSIPILLGEPGVGKRALVRGLALRYALGPNPNRRLIAISLDQMIAGTGNATAFREALKGVLGGVREDREILLFLDSLAALALPRTDEAYHAACLLRAALSRNEARVITVGTLQSYQASLATDVILGRHFRPIIVPPLGRAETLAILRNQKSAYEAQHNVRIEDEALEAAVDLSDRYLSDRVLPGKALQVLDEAGATLRLRYLQQAPEELLNLEAEIETLGREKEAAVAVTDFEQAARLRDQVEQLKERHQKALRQWQEEAKQQAGCIDRQAVAEVVSRMTGKTIP